MSAYTDLADWCEPAGELGYRTTWSVAWEVGRKGSGLVWTVPQGFTFDCSVPWWARLAFDPHDARYLKASALHDHMLANGWSRVTAGAEFHQALRADGVGRLRRLLMWLAVSLYRWA